MTARTALGFSLFAATLLAACGTPAAVDSRRVALMPEAVAWRSIEKYLGADWVAWPHLENSCRRDEKMPVSLAAIRLVRFSPVFGNVVVANSTAATAEMTCDDGYVTLEGLSREQADELATALASLGAPLDRK